MKHGFKINSQRGSHIKLRRRTLEGGYQTLTIANHEELDIGTLRAILRQAAKYITLEELMSDFYNE